ncbi:LPXTG-motif cell wall anchor domain-containing protein [Lacticaseibacillus brantae DSM 23927]|uniref:LPXTG-motif cell wall anchor domain-containing protein n=2 Tax=Lacticaseibacillus brantae TaxID=943673 RepID=A0A0R2AW38_9LACO|nr:LPXTG-motif cell wall anchor domain-containing protein [Lacticaseibacillus brantae DSM 23927]
MVASASNISQAAGETTPAATPITTAAELQSAVSKAPTDNTPQTLALTADITLTQNLYIAAGQNITIVNQDASRHTISLPSANRVTVAAGGTFNLEGQTQPLALQPVSTETTPRTSAALEVQGQSQMTNTAIWGFTITAPSGRTQLGTVVVNKGTLTLNDKATVQNNTLQGDVNYSAAGVMVRSAGTLNLNAGSVIYANQLGFEQLVATQSAGGINVEDGSHLVMNAGSSVQDNMGSSAGGILIGDKNNPNQGVSPLSTFIMNGGYIHGNTGWVSAGGVFVNGNGAMTMNAGEISANAAGIYSTATNNSAAGGGIAVSTGASKDDSAANTAYYDTNNQAELTINGGTISDNRSAGTGGGIYVNSNHVQLNAVQITNNQAITYFGGGIYVSYSHYKLDLKNTIITQNTAVDGQVIPDGQNQLAAGTGGGVWICPTGSGDANITDGVAIFANTAVKQGNDFASINKTSTDYSVTLANRQLGGGTVAWYHDRDGQQETNPVTIDQNADTIALKAKTSDAANTLATSMATVVISGNSAPRGGGVGSNGSLEFGQPGTKQIQVNKVWHLTSGKAPESVTINLLHDGAILQSLTLNAQNHWQGSFTDLPTDIDYTVSEAAVPGYTSTQTPLTPDPDNPSLFHVTFTNTQDTPNTPTKQIDVNKVWQINDGSQTPDAVKINLINDDSTAANYGQVIDSLTLNSANHWQGSFTNLPVDGHYRLEEDKVAGFTSSQTPLTQDPNNVNLYHVTFTNTKPGLPSTNPTTKQIVVNKVWNITDGSATPTNVTIHLIDDDPTSAKFGQVVDTLVLSAANNWQGSFTNLPSTGKYRIEEVPVPGFTSSQTMLTPDPNDSNRFSVTITNSKPNQPTIPTQPNIPGLPNTNKPKTPVKPKTPTQPLPKTGEANSLLVSLTGLLILLASAGSWLTYKRRS